MSEKLREHLARQGGDQLKPLLGHQVVDLLQHVGQEAMAPEVMADLIITSRGAAAVLRDKAIRNGLINKLANEDVKDLCEVLGLPLSVPRLTVTGVNFDMPNMAAKMFEWFGVPYETPDRLEGLSRNVVSAEKLGPHQEPAYRKLRPLLDDPSNGMLLHMPFGAGKLRTVATAVLEAFRSEASGKSILWLASDDCLCEEAMSELELVWQHLGLRDVTSYRFFGGRGLLPPNSVTNALVVADIGKLASAISDPSKGAAAVEVLADFGVNLRYVVLSDAEHVGLAEVRHVLEALGRRGRWNLVGISASPSLAIDPSVLVTAYGRNIVSVEDERPLEALRRDGEVDPINVVKLASPIPSLDCADQQISLPETVAEYLSVNLERNKTLLDKLHELSHQGQRIVFYATTAQQARMFAGLLELKGTTASAVTSEMEPARRRQEIAKFNATPRRQVLCVHGILVSSEQVEGVDAVFIALPTVSGALLHEMIGRLATKRHLPQVPLRIYAMTDPVPYYLRLVDNLHFWARSEV